MCGSVHATHRGRKGVLPPVFSNGCVSRLPSRRLIRGVSRALVHLLVRGLGLIIIARLPDFKRRHASRTHIFPVHRTGALHSGPNTSLKS